jgi:hypothetical protein
MSMSVTKRKFTAFERWAVYTVHGDKCYLCGGLVDLTTMEIDHIIPESILADPARFRKVTADFGLSPNFNLNDYGNWMPSCRKCNNRKRDIVFSYSPAIQLLLQEAIEKSAKAREIEVEAISNKKVAKLLNEIERIFHLRASDMLAMSLFAKLCDTDVRSQFAKEVEIKIPGNIALTLAPGNIDKEQLVTCSISHEKDGRVYTLVYAIPWADIEIRMYENENAIPRFRIEYSRIEFKANTRGIEFPLASAFLDQLSMYIQSNQDSTYYYKANLPAVIYDRPAVSSSEHG